MGLFKKKRSESPPTRWLALAIVLLAAFMDLLDVTIVNVAIPSIQHNLAANYAAVQWILAGYTLAFAVFLIAGGRLGDIFGRKRLFMIGVAGFTLASLLCGIAGTPEQLIAARIFQGIMAAAMIPQVLTSLMVLFPSTKERLSATGMYAAIAGLATVGGPIVGGLLIQANLFELEWRSIFLVNIPVGLFALLAAAKFLPESKSEHPLKVDWVGMGLITAALFCLLFPIIQGRELEWPLWSFLMMAASLPLFALFGWYENYKTKKDNSPLVVFELFRERAFISGLAIFILFMGGLGAYFLLTTLFMQIGLGYNALLAGLAGVPFSIGIGIASGALTPKLVPKLGRRVLHIGAIFLVVAMLSIAALLQIFDAGITAWHLVPSFLVAGLGMGMVMAPLFNFIIAGVPHRDAGSASGVLSAVQQVGSAAGVAVLGVLFFNLLTVNAAPSVDSVEGKMRTELQQAGVPEHAQTAIAQGVKACFIDRAKAKDQAVEPKSCQQARQQASQLPGEASKKIGEIVQSAATRANTQNFLAALKQIMLYLAAVFAAVYGLVFLLPKKAPEALPEEAMAT